MNGREGLGSRRRVPELNQGEPREEAGPQPPTEASGSGPGLSRRRRRLEEEGCGRSWGALSTAVAGAWQLRRVLGIPPPSSR